ncbi:MAG: protein kinase [Proteobacteria bacterium]|nr:protein kinase [Pseudomonadota bacterium]
MPRCPTCYRRLAGGATCPDDGATAPYSLAATRAASDVPPRVPGYTLGRALGAGGFAVVWAGQRDIDQHPVALKIGSDESELAILRLTREAAALAAIGPSAVPAYYAIGRLVDGRPYVVMERLIGQTLAQRLESLPRPPGLRSIRQMSRAILRALRAVHKCGVIHRDLKPENVFLISESPIELRLMDFGLARPVAEPTDNTRVTRTGMVVGTVEYMAPEQLQAGATVDERTDIYAFGVILYEMFTLRPPFVGDRASIEHGHTALRPPRPRQFAAVPAPVEDVILDCLAKDPAKRPRVIRDLRADLDSAWRRADPRSVSRLGVSKTALLVAKRQPVVLAVVDTEAAPDQVMNAVKQCGGFVARQRGQRYLSVFSSMATDDPALSALAAVDRLADHGGGRAALHLTSLALRRKRRGPPSVVGRAVDSPEIWLPREPWSGVLVSAALAQTQPDSAVRAIPGHNGFFVLVGQAETPVANTQLIARDHILARVQHSMAECFTSASPGLFTLLGEAGLGKSRMAHAIAVQARASFPDVEVISARATRTSTGGAGESTARLTAAIDGLGLNAGRPTNSSIAGGSNDPTDRDAASGGPGSVESEPDAAIRPTILVLDDAHWADAALLDQIEYATLDHADRPLWIAVIALPRLEAIRARWGIRANRHDREVLPPLVEKDAMALAAELLKPAEYPPTALLRRLARWSGGSPHLLTGLVAELKRRGVVRRHGHGEGWHVATAELEVLPAQAAGQWLATRLLDEMPPELAACVRVCSVLGPAFSAGELARIQDAIEEHGGAGSPVDTDVGLAELVACGTLRPTGDGEFAFRSPAFQDSVYKLLADSDRTTLHRYAAEYWRSELDSQHPSDDGALERFARHAGACNWVEDAAAAFVKLGTRALHSHRHVEADNHYTAALRYTDRLPRLQAIALGGRGKVRHLIHRIPESLSDLAAARRLADELGDRHAAIEFLLEEATAADSGADWQAAAACAEEARDRLDHLDDARLTARCTMALGRAEWRNSKVSAAIDLLSEAARQAREVGDNETEMLAKLLLAPALVWNGQLIEAEPVFEETLDLCTHMGDRFHQCGVYANRMFLWAACKKPDRAMEDLRRAMQIAREVGNPSPERVATHNLAELLYRSGEREESLALARRSRVLQERFWKHVPEDALLLARIHTARMEYDDASSLLEWLERECSPQASDPIVHSLYRAVALVLAEKRSGQTVAAAWQELVDRARHIIPAEEFIEVLWWRASVAISAERRDEAHQAVQEAQTRLGEAAVWTRCIDELAQLLS